MAITGTPSNHTVSKRGRSESRNGRSSPPCAYRCSHHRCSAVRSDLGAAEGALKDNCHQRPRSGNRPVGCTNLIRNRETLDRLRKKYNRRDGPYRQNRIYTFPPISPGAYTVRVEASGMRLALRALMAGAKKDVDFGVVMEVGSLVEPPDIPYEPAEMPSSLSYHAPGTPDNPLKTTLCEMLQHSERFNNQTGRFRAIITYAANGTPRLMARGCDVYLLFKGPNRKQFDSQRKRKDYRLLARYQDLHWQMNVTAIGRFNLESVRPVERGMTAYSSFVVSSFSHIILDPSWRCVRPVYLKRRNPLRIVNIDESTDPGSADFFGARHE